MTLFAVLNIKGKQYKVREGDLVLLDRMNGKPGETLSFSQVLVAGRDGKALIGNPYLQDARVTAIVKKDGKGKKVIVFKKKKRKDYKKTIGHRQLYTQVKIEEITVKGLEKEEAKDGS